MAFEDIIGADVAIGAETLELLRKNPEVLKTLAERNASALLRREPTKSREYPLGFPETSILAGDTANVVTFPQIPFRGERLVIPSDIAGLFAIDDIKVGKNSQLVASGPLPARAFSEVSVGVGLHLDTAQVSQQITLVVRNISGQTAVFRGMLIGRAVE